MQASARILGQQVGLTGEEMNRVLYHEGYIQGEPGDYTITDKGKAFAKEKDYHRGTGGYSTYNRYWTERTFDDKIMNEIDFTSELKQLAKEDVSERRRRQREERQRINTISTPIADTSELIEEDTTIRSINAESDPDKIKQGLITGVEIAAVAVVVVGTLYCGYKFVFPKVKNVVGNIAVHIKEKNNKG